MKEADYLLAQREAAKYKAVWNDPSYRKVSPAMFEVERAFVAMGCQTGESLNDYGCGTGRASKWFQDRGLEVLGIDHAENACEEDVPFLLDCLWDMTVPVSDYGFCCDVMEHIPPSKVPAVLETIASRTRKVAWFRIATRPDVMGPKIIGEPLHLTIQPGDWWRSELGQHFNMVQPIRIDGQDAVFMCDETHWL